MKQLTSLFVLFLLLFTSCNNGQAASDKLNWNNNLEKAVMVELYDVVGNLIMTQDNVDQGSRISISSLNSGIYFIRVDNEDAIMFIKK